MTPTQLTVFTSVCAGDSRMLVRLYINMSSNIADGEASGLVHTLPPWEQM